MNKPIAGITPMKTLIPAFVNKQGMEITDQVIQANAMLTELHDYIQMNIPGSRERALVLTKLEEAHHWLVATQAS